MRSDFSLNRNNAPPPFLAPCWQVNIKAEKDYKLQEKELAALKKKVYH